MTKYTPLTKYDQLKDGMRVRCKIQSYGTIEGRLNECADTTILFISDNDEKSFVITRVYFNPEIKRTNPYYFDLELIEEAQDEPEPTIEPYQWYTPQEILEYVKADPRPDDEKRFKLLITGNLAKNEEINVTLSDLIGNGIDVFSKEVKMQFLHWCDEDWEKLTEKGDGVEESDRVKESEFLDNNSTEKPLEQQENKVGSGTDALTKNMQFSSVQINEHINYNSERINCNFESKLISANYVVCSKDQKTKINLTINYQDKTYSITTPSGDNFIFKNTKNNNLELVKLLEQAVTFAQNELGIK
jgi:hypothetical protein